MKEIMFNQIPKKWLPRIRETEKQIQQQKQEERNREWIKNSIVQKTLREYKSYVEPAQTTTTTKRKRKHLPGLFAFAKSSYDYVPPTLDDRPIYGRRDSYPIDCQPSGNVLNDPRWQNVMSYSRKRSSDHHEYDYRPKQLRFTENPHQESNSQMYVNDYDYRRETPRMTRYEPEKPKSPEPANTINPAVRLLSNKLDSLKMPTISLFDDNKLLLSNVETKYMREVLTQAKQTVPIMDMIRDRSDWFLCAEELNDSQNYEPTDSRYTSECISEMYDRYEKRREEPTYKPSKILRDQEEPDLFDVSQCFESQSPKKLSFDYEKRRGYSYNPVFKEPKMPDESSRFMRRKSSSWQTNPYFGRRQ